MTETLTDEQIDGMREWAEYHHERMKWESGGDFTEIRNQFQNVLDLLAERAQDKARITEPEGDSSRNCPDCGRVVAYGSRCECGTLYTDTKFYVAMWTDGEYQGVSDHPTHGEAKAYLDAMHDTADFLADRTRLKAFLLPEQVQEMLAAIEPGYWLNSALQLAGLDEFKTVLPESEDRPDDPDSPVNGDSGDGV
jgi:hypothetical protein